MNTTPLHEIVLLEDSEDEVFLARRVLARRWPSLTLRHYALFEELLGALDDGSLAPDAPDAVIVLDLNLTIGSGIDALRVLRTLEATRAVTTGFCTGSEDPADRRDALAAGADFFVSKPLFPVGIERCCETVEGLCWEPEPRDGLPLRRIATAA